MLLRDSWRLEGVEGKLLSVVTFIYLLAE